MACGWRSEFRPIDVELVGNDGEVHTVTVIGVISEDISSLYGLYAAQETIGDFQRRRRERRTTCRLAIPARPMTWPRRSNRR